MKAKSIKGKSTEEVKTAVEQSKSDGFSPTLAICFISKSQDRKAISELLDEAGVAIFGCTTNGEFIDETTEKNSAAILLLDMNKDYFQIFFEEYPEKNYREISRGIAQKASERFSIPAFLIGTSHSTADGEEILHGIEDIVGSQVNAYEVLRVMIILLQKHLFLLMEETAVMLWYVLPWMKRKWR